MNVMQHHMVGDCSKRHLTACLIRELAGWTFLKREAFYSEWKKHHTKKSMDWLAGKVDEQIEINDTYAE